MGYVYIITAALVWGSLGPVARFVLESGIDPLEISFWRAAIAGALFAAHAAMRRRLAIARRDVPAVVAFALIGVTLLYWAYFQAVRDGGAALAAILLYTAPAWVALASALWLGERLTSRKIAAIGLTLAGVALVATGVGDAAARATVPAIAWGLLSGLAYAMYYLFGKRYFARYEAATLFALALPIGALALLPVVPFVRKTSADWLVLIFIAVVPTYLAYLLYSRALARIEATRAATAATIEPVSAAILAVVIWGEALRAPGYAGAALVLLGVIVVATAPTATLAAGRPLPAEGSPPAR